MTSSSLTPETVAARLFLDWLDACLWFWALLGVDSALMWSEDM